VERVPADHPDASETRAGHQRLPTDTVNRSLQAYALVMRPVAAPVTLALTVRGYRATPGAATSRPAGLTASPLSRPIHVCRLGTALVLL
jgi:hypothetical protein